MADTIKIAYEPQPKQEFLHKTNATFVLYGGAAGGGKSKALRMDGVAWCLQVPGIQVYLFRRTLPELEDNHIRFIRDELPSQAGTYNETKHIFTFPNKSALHFCFAQRDEDVKVHQGAEMHVLLVDEAALMSEFQLSYLMTRNRLGGFREKVPEKYRRFLPRAVFGSNPGGPGHHWLKDNFIDRSPPMFKFEHVDYKRTAIFIPAKMTDNRYIDKGYEFQFVGLPVEYARALKEGDWDAVVGQALPAERGRHMVEPFAIPQHWTKFMSIDWGLAKPFAVCWFCVSDGVTLGGRFLPKGAVILYREWYGWNGQRNQGSRMPAAQVGTKILEIEHGARDRPDYRIADSSMWSSQDGPSPAEAMIYDNDMALQSTGRKDRASLYSNAIAYLQGDADGPRFFAFLSCEHFWRTVPALTMDLTNPEKGYDSDQEDHIADAVLYGLYSRPYITSEFDRRVQADPDLRKAIQRKRKRGGDPYATA